MKTRNRKGAVVTCNLLCCCGGSMKLQSREPLVAFVSLAFWKAHSSRRCGLKRSSVQGLRMKGGR